MPQCSGHGASLYSVYDVMHLKISVLENCVHPYTVYTYILALFRL